MSDSHLALAVGLISAACAMNLYLSVALYLRVRAHDRVLGKSPLLAQLDSLRQTEELHGIDGDAELIGLLESESR